MGCANPHVLVIRIPCNSFQLQLGSQMKDESHKSAFFQSKRILVAAAISAAVLLRLVRPSWISEHVTEKVNGSGRPFFDAYQFHHNLS